MKGIFTLILAFAFGQLPAQTPSGIKEIAFADLQSASGQAYRIFISLPADYGQTGKRYPVLYILDADFNFLHLANLARQLADSNHFEHSIMIGIGYGTHGHSMGGLFLTYLLFKQPGLFDRYLITSPSLWWDKEKVFAYETQYYTQHRELEAKVFLSVAGKEGKVMRKNWARLKTTLENRNYTGLELKTRYYPDQTHIGVIPGAVEEGLLYLHQSE